MQKRTFLVTVAAGALLAAAPVARAQATFPSQLVKLVVPYPAGGGTDFFARTVAQGMSHALGQPVVVENRPGASGMIGLVPPPACTARHGGGAFVRVCDGLCVC